VGSRQGAEQASPSPAFSQLPQGKQAGWQGGTDLNLIHELHGLDVCTPPAPSARGRPPGTEGKGPGHKGRGSCSGAAHNLTLASPSTLLEGLHLDCRAPCSASAPL